MQYNPVQRAGMRLSGMQRLGRQEQIVQAEADLAAAYLERYVQKAIDAGVDDVTRRRIAQTLVGRHPFAVWLAENHAEHGELGDFAREFAPAFPAQGGRGELRRVVEDAVAGRRTGSRTLTCFDITWHQHEPRCIRDGCEQTVDYQMSLCAEHHAEDPL